MARRRDLNDYITMIEKTLFSMVVLSLSLMAVVQVLITDENWRNYLNFASRLESQKIEINEWQEELPVTADMQEIGYITLKLEKYLALPNAYILINGREVKRFTSELVKIPVRRGDLVEVDGTYYKNSFDVIVEEVTGNLQEPKKNINFNINQDVVSVAEVKFVE